MLARLRERSEAENGFTLIELLVVMIIIAILMAVAVPTFLAQKNTAQKTKATANIKQIITAIESCASGNSDGTYGTAPTDCLQPTYLQSYEKGLVSLTIASGTSPALNGYAIAKLGTQGYVISAQILDAGTATFFSENHASDGTLLKNCGAAGTVTMTAKNTKGITGSKTCANGSWG